MAEHRTSQQPIRLAAGKGIPNPGYFLAHAFKLQLLPTAEDINLAATTRDTRLLRNHI